MRRILPFVIVVLLVSTLAAPAHARAGWKSKIDRMIGNRSMSVTVREEGRILYRKAGSVRRIPASGQKLLVSMALLDRVAPGSKIPTIAASTSIDQGVIRGNLWLLGRGDPSVTGGGSFGRALSFTPTRLGKLAKRIAQNGVTKVRGSVMGATSYFARDWWAPGWKSDFPSRYIALPTALSFDGNTSGSRHISDPELRAAKSLTKRLRELGVKVRRAPGAGEPPGGLNELAVVESAPLRDILEWMNRQSSNFFAEVLGKRLAVEAGREGNIANGAATIERWAEARNVDIDAFDSSGLSYANRLSTKGFTRLLEWSEQQTWFKDLRSTLAKAEVGTLEGRLKGVQLRAKTGTLENVSTLSGWVWLRQKKAWASFSIMSAGMYKSTAASIEDRIVRELTRSAR